MDLNTIYVKSVMAWHRFRERAGEALQKIREVDVAEGCRNCLYRLQPISQKILEKFVAIRIPETKEEMLEVYSDVFRSKTTWELVMVSGAVCGIEFCYAAETAFVTPTLLSLGLDVRFMTMVWCLSPVIGFFLTPLLGSLSDGCRSRFGRRRPFIVLFSVGILLGLVLVPNGHSLGIAFGDPSDEGNETEYNSPRNDTVTKLSGKETAFFNTQTNAGNFMLKEAVGKKKALHSPDFVAGQMQRNHTQKLQTTKLKYVSDGGNDSGTVLRRADDTILSSKPQFLHYHYTQPWSIFFTVAGTVLLDFCCDACQSPSRTYLLDVTIPEDHGKGLTTFTVMAGLGGSIGYLMGAVDWEATSLGNMLGGHVKVVFAIVTVFFFICLLTTLTSFPEIPLDVLNNTKTRNKTYVGKYEAFEGEVNEKCTIVESRPSTYGTAELPEQSSNTNLVDTDNRSEDQRAPVQTGTEPDDANEQQPTLKQYLLSIFRMPKSLKILCLTNLFCWMSLVCYSLYFTDFVGESVYGGNPRDPAGSEAHNLYEEGVRFGCLGMALYSLSCSAYSFVIEKLVKKFGAKPVYVGGQLAYSLGMIIMAISRHKAAVIILSPTAGIMYSTLFTMPYVLIAHYHCMQQFDPNPGKGNRNDVRGIGTDIATVSSMVFLAQFVLSLTMGSIVAAVKSSVATVCAAALLSACGAACATQVFYLDL